MGIKLFTALFRNPYAAMFLWSVICTMPAYLFGYAGHDCHIHGLWAKHFSALLADGHIYPRFAHEMNAGFGSFAFFFYPPISMYASSLFAWAGEYYKFFFLPVAMSANLSLFISGLTCFWWLRDKASTTGNAVICGMFYMSLPGHLMVDFYTVGVLGQLWAYAWFPLILLGTEKIASGQRHGTALMAVGYALLAMTNIPAAIIFVPFAAIYGIVLCNPREYTRLISGWFLAAGLSAIYILPVLMNMDMASVGLHWTERFNPANNFVEIKLTFAEGNGYRVAVMLSLVTMAMLLLYFIPFMPSGKRRTLVVLFPVFSFFMCFSVSGFLWEILPVLEKVQFPWRFLLVPAVFVVLAAVYAANHNRLAVITAVIILMVAINFSIGTVENPDAAGDEGALIMDEAYKNNIEAFSTYLPSENVAKKFVAFFAEFYREIIGHPRVRSGGGGTAEITRWESRDIELAVSAGAGEEIIIRQFYSPYWKAWLEGKELEVTREGEYEILKVRMPNKVSGAALKLEMVRSPAEKLGLIISALSSLIMIYMVFRGNKNAKV